MEPTTLLQSRHEHVSSLDSNGFQERLTNREKIVSRFTQVVMEAVENNEIESWEYPHIEAALGIASASVFGVPLPSWGPGYTNGGN